MADELCECLFFCCEGDSCDNCCDCDDCCDCDCALCPNNTCHWCCCWLCWENTTRSAGAVHVPVNSQPAQANQHQQPLLAATQNAVVMTQPPSNQKKDKRNNYQNGLDQNGLDQNEDDVRKRTATEATPCDVNEVVIADGDFPQEPPPSYSEAISRQ